MLIQGGSLADLMSAMSQGDSEASAEEYRTRFSEAQAREMLREAKLVLDQTHELKPGDIVRRKRGLEDNRRAPCGGVMIFLRHGMPDLKFDSCKRGVPLGLYEEDCVVGEILSNGAMAEYGMCTRYLEPAPEPEEPA